MTTAGYLSCVLAREVKLQWFLKWDEVFRDSFIRFHNFSIKRLVLQAVFNFAVSNFESRAEPKLVLLEKAIKITNP